MYFVVYCKDSPENLRPKYRADHLQFVLENSSVYRFGGPLIDDAGKVVGSLIIFNVKDRAEVDKLLATDPYFTNRIFSSIEIHATRQIVPEESAGALAAELEKEIGLKGGIG
jgi:uncharacterized protein YciI